MRAAVVQAGSLCFDTPSSLKKLGDFAADAARQGAELAVFPEAFLGGYPKGADFAMTLGEFYCAKLDAPVLFDVKREGVVYARVYDIRGRSISTLLTVRGPDS